MMPLETALTPRTGMIERHGAGRGTYWTRLH
jgi:hypothetical protein